ncbi:MAG TPA: hypothetical protein ENI94_11505 [Gammaproteobacteria bacterium]|nr:hypothetical protein [Gammaproteobacteria bacterium]
MKDKQHIQREQAEPGMTLAQDLLDLAGHPLMTTGTALTERRLAGLRRRGIRGLVVWGTQELDPQQVAAQRATVQAQLDQRFRQVEQEPTMRELKALLLDYRLAGLE